MRIVVNTEKCTGCEQCIESCPYTAIVMKDGKAYINEYCQFCRTCLSVCPEGAIVEIAEEGDRQEVDTSGYKGVWVFAKDHIK
ncbi:MAG: 4Fe-4S binding protein, partial [Nitrospirae bacterium]|nr:4Fe-4S binding protein [Nitrospirota bacterium]